MSYPGDPDTFPNVTLIGRLLNNQWEFYYQLSEAAQVQRWSARVVIPCACRRQELSHRPWSVACLRSPNFRC